MAKTCNNCGTEEMAVMPIAEHEKDQNRLMEIIKSLIAVILVLIVLLVGSNIAWIVYESQFEDVVTTAEEHYDVEQNAEGGGDNNSIINGGVVNGEAENKVHEEDYNQNP